MAKLSSPFYFLIFCACLLIPINKQAHPQSAETHVALFIFGDSFFDAGNNNYLKNAAGRANFFPYGETFFKYPTGRFSDGRIIPDFIAEYLKIPFVAPYLQPGNHWFTNGVNFASAGAGALVETNQGRVIDLRTQLTYFKNVEKELRQKLGDTKAKALLGRAIYLFSIGTNDYIVPFLTNIDTALQNFSRKEYVGMVIGNLTTVINEIYKNGGRNFGFSNLGPLGLLPIVRAREQIISGGLMEQVTVIAKQHNKALSNVLKELKTQLPGFRYSNFSFYDSLSERINNPSKFGFKEGKAACCGSGPFRANGRCGVEVRKEYELCESPSEYLFFDSAHPTEKCNNQLAKLMWSGNPKVTRPYNLKTLVET